MALFNTIVKSKIFRATWNYSDIWAHQRLLGLIDNVKSSCVFLFSRLDCWTLHRWEKLYPFPERSKNVAHIAFLGVSAHPLWWHSSLGHFCLPSQLYKHLCVFQHYKIFLGVTQLYIKSINYYRFSKGSKTLTVFQRVHILLEASIYLSLFLK